jgi:hypothetical protein
MTHEEQIEADLIMYGVAVERELPDGSIERIDPTTIRVITRQDRDDKFFPTVLDVNLKNIITYRPEL